MRVQYRLYPSQKPTDRHSTLGLNIWMQYMTIQELEWLVAKLESIHQRMLHGETGEEDIVWPNNRRRLPDNPRALKP